MWQKGDHVIGRDLEWVEAGQKPDWEDMRREGASLRAFLSTFGQLFLVHGVLHRRGI